MFLMSSTFLFIKNNIIMYLIHFKIEFFKATNHSTKFVCPLNLMRLTFLNLVPMESLV